MNSLDKKLITFCIIGMNRIKRIKWTVHKDIKDYATRIMGWHIREERINHMISIVNRVNLICR